MSSTSNPFNEAAKAAAKKTDEQLAGEEAKLALPTRDQLRKMLPDPMDQQELDELMKIVNSATDHNEKVASLISNINKLGGVVVKVLSKFP